MAQPRRRARQRQGGGRARCAGGRNDGAGTRRGPQAGPGLAARQETGSGGGKRPKRKSAGGEQARQTAERKRFDLQWPAGKQFQDCAVCPQMVVVPAGSFTMGGESEEPRHRVTIRQRFAVGKVEIAFAEWDACVRARGCGNHRAGDRNWGRGQRPAINVNWRDARSYVRWLRQLTGQPYRLLSEAEWEYAARAGTRTAYPWGVAAGRNRANCKGCGSRWDGRKTAKDRHVSGKRIRVVRHARQRAGMGRKIAGTAAIAVRRQTAAPGRSMRRLRQTRACAAAREKGRSVRDIRSRQLAWPARSRRATAKADSGSP